MSPIALVRLCLLCLIVELNPWTYVASFSGMELELVRTEQVTGSHLVDTSGVRVKKFNRTVAVFDGEFEVVRDLDKSYQGRISAAYSVLGNNQFIEYPMKIHQQNYCQLMSSTCREYQHLWVNHTNFPVVGDEEELCPVPKGVYWIRNWVPEPSWIPSVVPEAYWRLTLDILDTRGTVQFRVRYFMRISRKFFF